MDQPADTLTEVHRRAMRRFDEASIPQQEMRSNSLLARRFVAIPGAQWDGTWGEQFASSIKVEVNKVGRGVRKIMGDYQQNRVVPDFRPDGGESDQDTADTLDGLHRADDYRYKAQQARDNAVYEALCGGFGAYRLKNELEDEHDRDNDFQRINPALIIPDADQRVFFDPQSMLYDKSDARFAFVMEAFTREGYAEEFGERADGGFPDGVARPQYDWFTTDTVFVAEYYEVEAKREKLFVLTQTLAGIEERLWSTEIDAAEMEERKLAGWQVVEQRRKRRRVRKYALSGARVLEDMGHIAGDQIPIVPVYGQRFFVDGMERWKGHVQDRMDPQRLYNSNVSRLAETNARSPQEIPIFAAQQMASSAIQELWARAHIDRLPYLLVEPLYDPASGQIVNPGPIGYVKPPELAPVTAALLQIANTDLIEDDADGANEVKANTSAEAMDIAAARVDAKSGPYLDNIRQSTQREGEIYLSMAGDVYGDEGRKVQTMSEDGDDGTAILKEEIADEKGQRTRNDLTRGRYKVIASVSEKTATRRDKTVKAALSLAETAVQAQDIELARACLLTAAINMDGEGMDDLKAYVRRLSLSIGLVEPNEEEQAAQEQAAQNAQPDPTQQVMEAQAKALTADAAKKEAEVERIGAQTALDEAKTLETLAGLGQPRIRKGNQLPVA